MSNGPCCTNRSGPVVPPHVNRHVTVVRIPALAGVQVLASGTYFIFCISTSEPKLVNTLPYVRYLFFHTTESILIISNDFDHIHYNNGRRPGYLRYILSLTILFMKNKPVDTLTLPNRYSIVSLTF